jgi:hypothetical protein
MTKWEVQYLHSITHPNLLSKEEPTSNECKTQYVSIFHFILFFLFLGFKMKPIEMKLIKQRKKGKKEGR